MNSTLLTVVKFLLTILLLPIVWAVAVVFHQYVLAMPGTYDDFFFWGMFGFVVIFLFFYQFWGVYEFGQKMVSGLLQFTSPANHFIAKVIPFYVTCILLLFYVIKHFFNADQYDHYFMFFTGFALTMHILLTAQDLQENEKALIKPTYLFVMASTFILMAFYVILLFNLVLREFTALELLESVREGASDVYYFTLQKILRLG